MFSGARGKHGHYCVPMVGSDYEHGIYRFIGNEIPKVLIGFYSVTFAVLGVFVFYPFFIILQAFVVNIANRRQIASGIAHNAPNMPADLLPEPDHPDIYFRIWRALRKHVPRSEKRRQRYSRSGFFYKISSA